MCTICRKFKKGSISVEEAREQLEEQLEFLNEDHVEDIELMLFEAEDTYEYITLRREERAEFEDEEFYEEDDFPEESEEYFQEEEDE